MTGTVREGGGEGAMASKSPAPAPSGYALPACLHWDVPACLDGQRAL